MIDKLDYITVDGVDYPIAFTLNVMESIQEEYESMDQWSKIIYPKDSEIKLKDIIWIFKEMINEGIDIQNEEKSGQMKSLTHKQIGRLLTNIGMDEATNIIKNLTIRSTQTEEVKNELTT